jgi:hypothetical protein
VPAALAGAPSIGSMLRESPMHRRGRVANGRQRASVRRSRRGDDALVIVVEPASPGLLEGWQAMLDLAQVHPTA